MRPFAADRRWTWALDWAALFLFTAVLILPLFCAGYLDQWTSIESTFIADARFLSEHWPHPQWQPNWYCGTRTDYVYPPALRYGTAALVRYIPDMLPVHAYHLYIAFFYCFGIAAVYAFVRGGSQSRISGIVAAVAAALISPGILFAKAIREDTPLGMPYRLYVLVQYGEGPHMTALAWLPLALLFSFRTLQRWRPASLAGAVFCSTMVVANNFYGATSLAMLFPVLTWSIFITHGDGTVWLRAVAIAGLTAGLNAFWLVPSYIRITLANMRFVAMPGNQWSVWASLTLALVFGVMTFRSVRGRKDQAWFTFVTGSAALFFAAVIGNYYLNFRIIGEHARQYPELDLLLIVVALVFLRRLRGRRRLLIALVAACAFLPSVRYFKAARQLFAPTSSVESRLEYQMQDWVNRNLPQARVLNAGTVRFWYNVWHDLPEFGGGSAQGLLNPTVMDAEWDVYTGDKADTAVRWMQIMGVDALIVHERNSRQPYRDFQYPEKFRGRLRVLHDNGQGDLIYEVPRRFRSLARIVDRQQHRSLPHAGGREELEAWYQAVENGPDTPVQTRFAGTDILHVTGFVGAGQSVWIQESFDPNWTATSSGRQLEVRRDRLGFMVVDAPEGTQSIQLEFRTPAENRFGRIVSCITVLTVAVILMQGFTAVKPPAHFQR